MAQPKRDPNDRRCWPARLGGTGQGFTRHGKCLSSHYLGALSPQGSLSNNPRLDNVSHAAIQDAINTVSPEAVKAQARLVAIAALDNLNQKVMSMDASEARATLKAVEALTDAMPDRGNGSVNVNVGALHLAALKERAQLATPQRAQLVGASHVTTSHITSRITSPVAEDATIYSDTDGTEDTGGGS